MTITNEDGEEDKEALTYERQDFLGNHIEQTAQLFAAHRQYAEDGWQSGRSAAR